jgi:hypothetical protein
MKFTTSDVCILVPDEVTLTPTPSALEIFSVFILNFTSLMAPLKPDSTSIIERNILLSGHKPWRDKVARHLEVEAMADLLVEVAPTLFVNKEQARTAILPALIFHNFLS